MAPKSTVATRPRKSRKPAAPDRTTTRASTTYEVVLRTREMHITALVQDRVLYPKAVALNRLLTADQGRQQDEEAERRAWHQTGHDAIMELAKLGEVSAADAAEFIKSAAKCGEVQVEMDWVREDIGWAARVFPWEALIALATKELRGEGKGLIVVRVLRPKKPFTQVKKGPACFAVSAAAKKAGYDTATERAAINAALGKEQLKDLCGDTLPQLREAVTAASPRLLHYVLVSAEELEAKAKTEVSQEGISDLEEIARIVSSPRPQLVAFSTCHSGRRLAPLAVAYGAGIAVGFHGPVTDRSLPAFFGAFYRAWKKTGHALVALRQGLLANRSQKRPEDLGVVTVWSAVDLLGQSRTGQDSAGESAAATGPGAGGVIPPAVISESLVFTCILEASLNYSMLHNKRGGLFSRFEVLKTAPGHFDNLEINLRIATGLERPVECHFFTALPPEANRTVDFIDHVMVPLGSELLRRRGEMLRGTVEITIKCGLMQVFHRFDSIELPPCDEWKDDEAGRRYLPSFIFPRDPAVRDILSAAQPYLRALTDNQRAGFDGYQGAFAQAVNQPVRLQLRAIWAALQQAQRIDYGNPPPTYTRGVQRVRTPEEILRSRRATCIELALLLASCWEHIGIYPVIFLTPGHALTGYWAGEGEWKQFFDTKKLIDRTKEMEHARDPVEEAAMNPGAGFNPAGVSGGGLTGKDESWVLKAPHHLAMIHREVEANHLIPVEATLVAVQDAFGAAEEQGRQTLGRVRNIKGFDGMIDVQTARNHGVTPLAIITRGTPA